MKRIFINSIPAVGLWSYEGPFVHYITHVLRGKPGDSFLWFDVTKNKAQLYEPIEVKGKITAA